MCVIAVVMTGYGVASRSMVYYPHKGEYEHYNESLWFDGRSVFRDVIYPVYYLMHGEVSGELKNLDREWITTEEMEWYQMLDLFTETTDAGDSIATFVLLAGHMLFVNILLLNLLIGMFRYALYGYILLWSCETVCV